MTLHSCSPQRLQFCVIFGGLVKPPPWVSIQSHSTLGEVVRLYRGRNYRLELMRITRILQILHPTESDGTAHTTLHIRFFPLFLYLSFSIIFHLPFPIRFDFLVSCQPSHVERQTRPRLVIYRESKYSAPNQPRETHGHHTF